jgi:hypothetical protein
MMAFVMDVLDPAGDTAIDAKVLARRPATLAGATIGILDNNIYLGGEPLIALGPEHAATVAAVGWSKDDFKRAVWARARVPLSAFAPENIERFSGIDPEGFRDKPLDTLAPIARDWRDIMVIVVGGRGGKALGRDPDLRHDSIRHPAHRQLER